MEEQNQQAMNGTVVSQENVMQRMIDIPANLSSPLFVLLEQEAIEHDPNYATLLVRSTGFLNTFDKQKFLSLSAEQQADHMYDVVYHNQEIVASFAMRIHLIEKFVEQKYGEDLVRILEKVNQVKAEALDPSTSAAMNDKADETKVEEPKTKAKAPAKKGAAKKNTSKRRGRPKAATR